MENPCLNTLDRVKKGCPWHNVFLPPDAKRIMKTQNHFFHCSFPAEICAVVFLLLVGILLLHWTLLHGSECGLLWDSINRAILLMIWDVRNSRIFNGIEIYPGGMFLNHPFSMPFLVSKFTAPWNLPFKFLCI